MGRPSRWPAAAALRNSAGRVSGLPVDRAATPGHSVGGRRAVQFPGRGTPGHLQAHGGGSPAAGLRQAGRARSSLTGARVGSAVQVWVTRDTGAAGAGHKPYRAVLYRPRRWRVAYDVRYGVWWRSLATASVAFGLACYAWGARSTFIAVLTLLFVPVTAEAVVAQKKAAQEDQVRAPTAAHAGAGPRRPRGRAGAAPRSQSP